MATMIFITEFDIGRLRPLLESAKKFLPRDHQHIRQLEEELERAEIVPRDAIPADVITMNSTVQVTDLRTHKQAVYTLVFPRDADAGKNRISVLAPLGTALLGYRRGDVIEWEMPGGKKRLRVDKVKNHPKAPGLAA
jgi:regulator of nucleoside diphosphate kinase